MPDNTINLSETLTFLEEQTSATELNLFENLSFQDQQDTDIKLWLQFNETSGIIAYDSSPYGNNGTIVGALRQMNQRGERELWFDGDDDIVNCGADESLNFGDKITISAWICPLSYASLRQIVDKYENAAEGSYYLTIGKSSPYKKLEFVFIDVDGGYQLVSSVNDVPLNEWTFVTVTYDGDKVRIYFNGILDKTSGSIGKEIKLNSSQSLRIGGPYSNMHGKIDDVRIHNRALSQNEIQARYEATKGNYDPLGESLHIEKPWLEGWRYRRKITIPKEEVEGNLENFPVLVKLSSSSGINSFDITEIFDELGSDRKKMALTLEDGITQCYTEVEKWGFCHPVHEVLTFDSGEDYAILTEISGDYLYAITEQSEGSTDQSVVVKIRLSDFTRVDSLITLSGEGDARGSCIEGNYLYVACGYPSHEKIVKIDLTTFERVDICSVDSGEDLHALWSDGTYLYGGTYTIPAKLVRIDLATFQRVDAITFAAEDTWVTPPSGVWGDDTYIYVGMFSVPARIARVNKSSFTIDSTLELQTGEDRVYSMHSDGTSLYIGTFTAPSIIVKIDLATFSRIDSITLESGEDKVYAIGSDGDSIYCSTFTNPSVYVKIRLSDFTRVDTITMNSNQLSGKMPYDGHFLYCGSNQVPAEIERFDPVSVKEAYLWVKVPNIAADEDTILHLYYDSSQDDNTDYIDDPNSEVAENVWDDNYVLVTHMQDDPDTTHIRDSTQYDNDGEKLFGATIPTEADAKINKGQDFEHDVGRNPIIIPASDELDGMTELTLECWVKGESYVSYQSMIGAWTTYNRYILGYFTGGGGNKLGRPAFYVSGTGGQSGITAVSNLDVAVWYHIVGVFKGGDYVKIFINGQQDAIDDTITTTQINDNPNYIEIGEYAQVASYSLDGIVDEVRISNIVRLPEWVKASYETQRDHFLSFHNKETRIPRSLKVNKEVEEWLRINPVPEGLVAYWSLDEETGRIAYDHSGNANHGTLLISASTVVYDDDETIWVSYALGSTGNLDDPCTINEETNNKVSGESSSEVIITSGTGNRTFVGIRKNYSTSQDWTLYDHLGIWLYGINNGGVIRIRCWGAGGEIWYYDITDNFEGWVHFEIAVNDFLVEAGTIPRWDETTDFSVLWNTAGTRYVDRITLEGSLPTRTGGIQGRCLEFDGANDLVDCGNPPGLQITPKQSVSFWMYANSSDQMIPIMKKYHDNLDSWGWAIFLLFGGRIYIRGNGTAQFYVAQVYTNQWLHIVGVWNGNQGILYVNGEPTTGSLNEIDLTYMGNLKIGRGWSGYKYFNGKIDEVRVYNRVLTEEEVKILYNLGQERIFKKFDFSREEQLRINPVPEGLIAYWTFDEGIGNLAYDHSGNENTGTLLPTGSTIIYEDDETFWTTSVRATGTLGLPTISEESVLQISGSSCLKIVSNPGSSYYAGVKHLWNSDQNWFDYEFLDLWIYGVGEDKNLEVILANSDYSNYWYYLLSHNFTGWKKIRIDLRNPTDIWAGQVALDQIREIKIHSSSGVTWYLDLVEALGTCPSWKPGKIGKALSFDGENDWINCGNDPSLVPEKELSICFWLNNETLTDYDGILAKGGYGIGGRYEVHYKWSPTNRLVVGITTSNGWLLTPFEEGAHPAGWNFFVATYDGSNIRTYMNADLTNINPHSGSFSPLDAPFEIGRVYLNFYRYAKTDIDEVRIYNRRLTEEEIKLLFMLGQERLYKRIEPGIKQESLTFLSSILARLPWMQQVVRTMVKVGPIRIIAKLKEAIENL